MFFARKALAIAAFCVPLGLAQAHEKVTFPSLDADLKSGVASNLYGYLYKPKGAGPFPAVVVLHGCTGLMQGDSVHPLYGAWGERLSSRGFVALLPDSMGSRGHGDLCAFQPANERPVQPGREMPRDAYGALAYLRTLPDVQANNVAIFAQSFGAIATMFAIASDVAPRGTTSDFKAAVLFYPACAVFLKREPKWAPRMSTLLLMGEDDNWTPAAPCKELFARLKGGPVAVEAHYYKGAYHAFDNPIQLARVYEAVKLPDGTSPTAGAHPESRDDSVVRVSMYLAEKLK
jgi:dienelactone hydrolase